MGHLGRVRPVVDVYKRQKQGPSAAKRRALFCGHRGGLPHQLRPFGFSGADVHGALLSRCFHRLAGAHRHAGSAGDLYRLQLLSLIHI